MKVYTERFEFDTRGEFDVVDLTVRAEAAVERSGVQEGIAVIYAGHATGVIVLNEYEPRLLEDLKEFLGALVHVDGGYRHPANAHAHLKSMLLTPSRVVPVHGGRLGLGTWQSLYWVEVERRPRRRRVEAMVIGEESP
jgi:secondary thiamine-phosphate synthase enzyme